MDMHLVVVKPFDGLGRGDIITDPKHISQVMNSEHVRNVVRVAEAANKGV